jgi:hypothetical protein
MNGMQWNEVRDEAGILKDRRLLLIAQQPSAVSVRLLPQRPLHFLAVSAARFTVPGDIRNRAGCDRQDDGITATERTDTRAACVRCSRCCHFRSKSRCRSRGY